MSFGTVMVTGGYGFIGSNFIYFLHDIGFKGRIVNVDKMTYAADERNLLGVQQDSYPVDIADASAMEDIFAEVKPDAIVNFAAESHVDRSIDSSAPFVMTNVLGTQVLLDMAVKHGVSRFLQVSTDEVYGDLELDAPRSVETDVICPSSPYSASKAAADHFVMAYARTHGLNTVITRCSNNYGPRQYPEKLIPVVITKAAAGDKIPVYARGENIRDWIHVDDHCKAIWLALTKGGTGEVYNIGGDSERRNIEVVRGIMEIVGGGTIEFVGDRPGHDFRYAIDHSKATRELGWEPEAIFEVDLEKTVLWYMDNRL